MLRTYAYPQGEARAGADLGALPADAIWIDLLNPEPAETELVAQVTGLRMPRLDDLKEIESSSRLATRNGAIYLSAPAFVRDETGGMKSSPIGFILTRDRLITLRFEVLPSFEKFAESWPKAGDRCEAAAAFTDLLAGIIDRAADVLEHIEAELEEISHRIFRAEAKKGARSSRPRSNSDALQAVLRHIGRTGDAVSHVRDSLLAFGRMVPYAATAGKDWLPDNARTALDTLGRDVASLSDYTFFLTDKVQFLLDATLGLISIEQNNIVKVLTVVSVVGIPPTLIASMYGMNFKNMPELSWEWGYPYGLILIALSAIVPVVWFKLRGWL